MRITAADLQFWSAYHAPGWARSLVTTRIAARSIHGVINGHAGVEPLYRGHASNTCALVRGMARRLGIRPTLYQLMTTVSPPADPRRARRCAKWLLRVDRGRYL